MNENNNNELAMMLDILNKITYSIEDYLKHFIIKGPNHLHFITEFSFIWLVPKP